MNKFWMIVNISNIFFVPGGVKIPQSQTPRFMHSTRERADTELLRLQERFPRAEFVLLESIATAQRKTIYVVEPIETDDGIPF